jgi:hypothetical protein
VAHIIYITAGIVAQKELFQIVKLIPVEVYGTIFTTLGPGRTSYTSVCEEIIVTLLTDWQKQHPSNRRETLARILLKMGCYKAAIKLDAKSKHFFVFLSERWLSTTTSSSYNAKLPDIQGYRR